MVSNGLEVGPGHLQQFKNKFNGIIKKSNCVLIGGSVPHGLDVSIYTDLVQEARKAGVPVVFDASGAGLRAGMEGHPTIAKPNIDEISDLAGQNVTSIESAYRVGMELQKKYDTMLVITLGAEGALAVLGDRAYRIPALKVDVVSAAGAGDAVLAGLSAALSDGKPIEVGLKLGFAAAAAVCLSPATADCRRSDVERFVPQIELISYP